jgi:hypothetical protein
MGGHNSHEALQRTLAPFAFDMKRADVVDHRMPRAVQLPVQSKGTFHGQGNLNALLIAKRVAFTFSCLLGLSAQQRGWLGQLNTHGYQVPTCPALDW